MTGGTHWNQADILIHIRVRLMSQFLDLLLGYCDFHSPLQGLFDWKGKKVTQYNENHPCVAEA